MSILKFALAAALIGGTAAAATSRGDYAARAQQEMDRALAGKVAGEPVDCIQQRDITSTQIIDRTAILYKVGSTTYVNRPRGGAESLYSDPILVTDTHTGQLCSVDIVRLVDRTGHFQRGFVNLDRFVPYRKPR